MTWSSCVFIEGTRQFDKYLGEPNKGAMFLARLARKRIVPVGITKEGEDLTIRYGIPYEMNYKGDLEDQAWDCLEKISQLCDYKMPERNG